MAVLNDRRGSFLDAEYLVDCNKGIAKITFTNLISVYDRMYSSNTNNIKDMEELRMNESSKVAMATEMGREFYEESVIRRMEGRSGVTPKGAKGIALEVMDIDQLNLKDVFYTDRYTRMTKNPHAPQLDAITRENGINVKRYQYKDTPASTSKTLQQVKSGKYNQATLRGTKEAAKEFNTAAERAGINKRMESTGISSKDTKRVADKYLTLKDGTVSSTLGANITNAAKTSALGATGLTAAIEVGKSVVNGDSLGTCVSHVVSKGAESATAAATAGAVGELAFIGGAMINPVLAVPAAIAGSLLTCSAMDDAIEGEFDEIGDAVGELADTLSDMVGDFFHTVGCLFTILF